MVSVIVPNYNHAPFLKKRIDSILNQTYDDFELILLDDCSTDNSLAFFENYRSHPKVSGIISNVVNSGSPYVQWRKGIEASRGKYVWIAESDDFSEVDFLKESVEELEANDRAGLVCCKCILTNGSEERIIDYRGALAEEVSRHFKGMDFINKYLNSNCVILNVSSVVFRRSVFDQFSDTFKDLTRFRYYGDWYIYLTVAMYWDIAYLSTPLNYFRRPDGAFSNSGTTFQHLHEKTVLQNYVLKHTCDFQNYNKIMDHVYYEAYDLIRKSDQPIWKRISMIPYLVIHDHNGFRRLLAFIFTSFKSFLGSKR